MLDFSTIPRDRLRCMLADFGLDEPLTESDLRLRLLELYLDREDTHIALLGICNVLQQYSEIQNDIARTVARNRDAAGARGDD